MHRLYLVVAAFLYWPFRRYNATATAPVISALLWPVMFVFYFVFLLVPKLKKDQAQKISNRINKLRLIYNHVAYAMELYALLKPDNDWADREFVQKMASRFLDLVENHASALREAKVEDWHPEYNLCWSPDYDDSWSYQIATERILLKLEEKAGISDCGSNVFNLVNYTNAFERTNGGLIRNSPWCQRLCLDFAIPG